MKKICICGGGSLGHVIAGYLSANGKATVSILTNHPTAWQNKIEICVPDNGEMLIGNIACVSANPAEALLDAEIVLLCLLLITIDKKNDTSLSFPELPL